jgi:hypothetical protein
VLVWAKSRKAHKSQKAVATISTGDLYSAFGRLAVELAAGRPQIAFQKSDAVFDVAVATHKKLAWCSTHRCLS